MGVASALGGASVLLIAETWHRPLPVTIHDTEILHTKAAVPQQDISESKFLNQSKAADAVQAAPPTTGHKNTNKTLTIANRENDVKIIDGTGYKSMKHGPNNDIKSKEVFMDIKMSVESSL